MEKILVYVGEYSSSYEILLLKGSCGVDVYITDSGVEDPINASMFSSTKFDSEADALFVAFYQLWVLAKVDYKTCSIIRHYAE